MKNVFAGTIIFCIFACLIVTYSIRGSYNAYQREAMLMNFYQSPYGHTLVSIRASNNAPVQDSALSTLSMNVTNEDLEKMEVVYILRTKVWHL